MRQAHTEGVATHPKAIAIIEREARAFGDGGDVQQEGKTPGGVEKVGVPYPTKSQCVVVYRAVSSSRFGINSEFYGVFTMV